MSQLRLTNSDENVVVDDHISLHLGGRAWAASIHDRKGTTLPRMIMEIHIGRKLSRSERVVYKNRNIFDNRIENLDIVQYSDIAQRKRKQKTPATSKYKGVSWQKHSHNWRAQLQHGPLYIHIGMFENEMDAARAYDEAAIKHFGKYAQLNFPIAQEEAGK